MDGFKIIKTGETRLVLLVGRWAIKVPRIDRGGRQFLLGCLANLNERWFSRCAAEREDTRLATTFAAAPLGLVAVAERIRNPVIRRVLTPIEALNLPLAELSGDCGVDDNGHNVATRPDGTLVVIDYGNPGLMYAPEGPPRYRGVPREEVLAETGTGRL